MKKILTTIIMFSFLLMSATESVDIIKNIKTNHKIELRSAVDPGGSGH